MPQGKAISDDLALVIIRMSMHFKNEDISTWTGISVRAIEGILASFRRSGFPSKEKKEKTCSTRFQMSDDEVGFLLGTLKLAPDTYLDELQDMLRQSCGTEHSQSSIWRALRRCGFTMKKMTRVAVERSVEKRREYRSRIGGYDAQHLVFVDESACDRRTSYRGYAWSIKGTKAERKAHFVRGRRYSILPALSLDGMIHCHIIEGSFDSAGFAQFIEGLLDRMQPFPAPNSVIVMDNCRIHHNDLILQMITERGMRYEFLPPYSPDYNPIELVFSAVKYHIRRNGNIVRQAMEDDAEDQDAYARLYEAVFSTSQSDAWGWFRHCGYV